MKNMITNIFAKVALVVGLAVAFAGNAWADSYTIGWGAASGTTGTYSNFTATSGTVTGILSFSSSKNSSSSNPAYNEGASELRLYFANNGQGGSITLSPASGITITGFVMTTSTAPSVKYTVDSGSATSVSESNNTYTVTGISATSSLTIQNVNTSNTQLRIKTIQITYTSSSGPVTPTCATPSFSPAQGTYYGEQKVSISCTTDGATIYYTTDGNDPTTASNSYSGPINVSTTTTIKAFAVKAEYDDSAVATATYTIKPTVSGYNINFEDDPEAYVDWTMNNIQNTNNSISAYGGTKYGSNTNIEGNGVGTAYIQTKEKIEYPDVFTCYISKTSNNTTSSTWYIQVSSDGSNWTNVANQSATSMTAGGWTEFTANIKAAKYTDVYVRLYYNGSTAIRAVDNISLSTYTPATVEAPTITVPSEFTISTTATISCVTEGATIYYSYDNSTWTEYTEALTITSTITIYAKAIKGADQSTVSQVTTNKIPATPNVTISASSINIGETAMVSTNGPTVTLTTSSSAIASVEGATVSGVAAGIATITATWSANDDYSGGTKGFEVTVVDPNAPGSENNPYTVAQAIANTPSSGISENVYIHGIVSAFYNTSIVGDGSNYRYYISDDGTTSTQLLVYKGKKSSTENFSSADDLLVGDEVTIYGGLTTYNSTKEVASGNYLVNHSRPSDTDPSITLSSYSVAVDATGASNIITVTYKNITEVVADIQYYTSSEATETTTSPNWITASINNSNNLAYNIGENTTEEARTAYLKVWAFDDDENAVYSGLVTVTQAAPVVDYATLPFEWEGGTKDDLLDLTGVSSYGLGTNYAVANAPYQIKLDNQGDYILIKTNQRPGKVTIGVKMIGGGTTSKLKVQGSADGESFIDVNELTISGSANDELTLETSNEFASDARYVKIIKSLHGSNIGVGPIKITQYGVPSISVTPSSATPAASDTEGTLGLEYENLIITDETDFGVQFFDGDNEIEAPSWIGAAVTASTGEGYVVSYIMDANTGEARSAYFKVFAMDDNEFVYSNLVTITQAEYVQDYADLPFTWDEAYGTTPTGITINGSVEAKTDYLNMKTTDTEVILKINEIPGMLTFEIRGNSFSGGTFKVQTSVNGVDYADLASYTELGSAQSEEFSNIPTNVRYIKWVYTEKVNGNVGLGNIQLTAFDSAANSITLSAGLNGGRYWTTYYNASGRYTLPAGAQAFTMNASKQLYLLGADGSEVPANVAVIIIADSSKVILTKSEKTDSVTINGGNNILQGSNSSVATSGISGTPYVLGIISNTLGFYEFGGSSIPAFKAYYVVE